MKACVVIVLFTLLGGLPVSAQEPSLNATKVAGALRSSYRNQEHTKVPQKAPTADLDTFKKEITPLLKESCVQCHGPDKQKGKFRIDTLDPDLVSGDDAKWWVEVLDVISNGEMPPADEDVELPDKGKTQIVDWLSRELQVASQVARSKSGHSSFRRMTNYEYNYALRDLLGLPFNIAQDLPPETESEDGFQNSSEMLQMSASQFAEYRKIARKALQKATVRGEKPKPKYFEISMEEATERVRVNYEKQAEKLKKQHGDDPPKLATFLEKHEKSRDPKTRSGNTHFLNQKSNEAYQPKYRYGGSEFRWEPQAEKPAIPEKLEEVVAIPLGKQHLIDFGDSLPDSGTLRVCFRAHRGAAEGEGYPSLRLRFGFQASNNSKASFQVSDSDYAIRNSPDDPQLYECDIHLGELPRNPYREISEVGKMPNPSEYLVFENVGYNHGKRTGGDQIHIDWVEVTTPFNDQWPPKSHTAIFIESDNRDDEAAYAREILENFMPRAWRRPVKETELNRKLTLFAEIRPYCDDFQESIIAVLAGVLSSPQFLYFTQSADTEKLTDYELATRLSMFLWCSLPDTELLELAEQGQLTDPKILAQQTGRLLANPRIERFSEHFTRQWLGMQLLDFLNVDKKAYPQFNAELKTAMQEEPVAFFHTLLQENGSIIDLIHADYAMLNERLAQHYGIKNVYGNHFRKVAIPQDSHRGGLLTQAGLLAMNSDGKDSHPLKRGIWLLENLLHDPPPPPPPAVPEIDLADPEILKMTLKERMEDHRNDPACMSCHAKIDPWGVAFENFDAVGSWRDKIGEKPVDSSSLLFNKQKLHGMEGLKRFLLDNRQDQFTRAMVYKVTSYALGRPLSFSDRSEIEAITADLRQKGDGLTELITLIVTSDLFSSY